MTKDAGGALHVCSVLLALAVAFFCVLAPDIGQTHASSKAVTTIRLEQLVIGRSDATTMAAAITAFQKKYKHIKVAYTPFKGDFESHLETEYLSHSAPDVFEMDMGWARDFIEAGVVAKLNKYARTDKSFDSGGFNSSLVKGFSANSSTYAYPIGFSTLALFFNRSLFKAGHIKYAPRDWRSFTRIACELTNHKKHIYGAVLAPDAAHWFAFLPLFGGHVSNSKQTAPAIDSKNSIKALSWYAGLVRSGCAEEPPADSSDTEELALGHAAMTFDTSSAIPLLKNASPHVSWGASVLPTGPNGNSNLAFATGYAMNAHSKDKSAAWKLISYLSQATVIQTLDRERHYLPGRRTIAVPKDLKTFADGAAYATLWSWPAGLVVNAFPQIGIDIDEAARHQESISAAVGDMAVWLKRYL